ncbi:Hypothetical protein PBC10988_20130 [Planctomycetales bacterium 10988]|nr:Hypothetical protein PBC10988_20130 [Planctomycetales bacterium 10988]
MNYFAHGQRFLDDPYYLAGTALPDWLSAADRRVRVRSKTIRPYCEGDRPQELLRFAQGVAQHHFDDDRFHQTRAFIELSWTFTSELKEWLREESGNRRGFLGHILVELLLDAYLIQQTPDQLKTYFQQLRAVDPAWIEAQVNEIAPRKTERLAWFIGLFLEAEFLWDYVDDAGLLSRLNGVMSRVGLERLPRELLEFLPSARSRVYERSAELLPPAD